MALQRRPRTALPKRQKLTSGPLHPDPSVVAVAKVGTHGTALPCVPIEGRRRGAVCHGTAPTPIKGVGVDVSMFL